MPNKFLTSSNFITVIIAFVLSIGLNHAAFAKKGGGGKNNNGGGSSGITILEQPTPKTAYAGDSVSFNIVASINKGPSIKYQWYFNGNEISASTRSQLTLSTIDANNEGEYHVRLKSGDRSSISQTALLIVDSSVVINSPPIAYDDNATTYEDTETTLNILANDHDTDGDTLIITSVKASNGTVSVNSDNTIHYTPPKNFSGQDTAFYSIDDGNGGTASAIVNIQISSVNDSPVALDDIASTNEDTPVTINVLNNDTDPEGQLLSITSASAINGETSISSTGALTYNPHLNFNGIDIISYSIVDSEGASARATVEVVVNAVADLRITYQPSSASVYIGSSHTLNVSAIGNGDLSYQWRKNGAAIIDSNASYFTLENISPLDSGQYEVVVYDSIEQLYSDAIAIDVIPMSGFVLNWDLPQYREDGTLLDPSDIESYRIYISPENLSTERVVTVSGDMTSYTIQGLDSGAYEFRITTVDSDGLEGTSSGTISATL